MAHDIRIDFGQCSQLCPRCTQARHVMQALTFTETELHPLVLVRQVPAAALASEPSPCGVSGAQSGDECGEIPRELGRARGVVNGCVRPGQQVWMLHGKG